MAYVIKLTSPEGDVYYGSEPDHEGLRYRTSSPDRAEQFESKEKAEGVFYWFKQVHELHKYSYEAIEV
jgi:hypothetical protein